MKKHQSIAAIFLFIALLSPGFARTAQTQHAPGAPGKDAQWLSAGKQGVGTSATLESKVWFTLQGGVMTEVYYPDVTVGNVQKLELIIVHGQTETVQTESKDTISKVIPDTDSLSFTQINTAKNGEYRIEKRFTVDPQRNVVLIKIQFFGHLKRRENDYRLFVYYDPSLNNSGMHDTAFTRGDALLASDKDKASALVATIEGGNPAGMKGFIRTSNGFLGTSDGLTLIEKAGAMGLPAEFGAYQKAENGNVVQVGELEPPAIEKEHCCARHTLALGFGVTTDEALKSARESLADGFDRVEAEYKKGWRDYLQTVRRVGPKYQAQFNMAAMTLKAHEDKKHRGANIASLSVPWGGGSNANEANVGGYHLVWARDLYQVATAYMALGDKAAALRALDFLFKVQQKPDGSFPQNSWLDGKPYWGSLQHDEVAFPLILAYQLGKTDRETYERHVRRAADFIVRTGPHTPQERWEEESGYSPSTIAAEIAGLVCAAEIAKLNGDEASANVYLAAADEWARNIEAWTATTTGPHGDKNYYIRVTENDDPNDGEAREINNGGGTFDERQIVDAGFLELVRLGIKPASDPLIAKSVAVVDKVIKVETPNGASFYRYNHDGYGEMDDGRAWNWDGKYTGKGRLWALLAGERGQYELARGDKASAQKRLDAMLGFANEGMMIPEQVWDLPTSPTPDLRFGEGTGAATPLAWSMAQFIRLAANLQEGRNLDTPDIVAARYIKQTPPARANADIIFPADEVLSSAEAGKSIKVRGFARQGGRVFFAHGDERRELKPDAQGRFEFDVNVTHGESHVLVGTVAASGATSFHRARVRGLSADEKRKEEVAQLAPEFVERVKTASASPLVEGERVTFVYRGDAKRVEVVGDFTGWAPRGHLLRELPIPNVKYYTLTFPKTARVEYKFIADGEWILDPLNPNRNDNGVGGENSFFRMPDYRGSTLADNPPPGPLMMFAEHEVPSRLLGGSRKIKVYLPQGYMNSRERYPVLYLQDGTDYYNRTRADLIAGNLIAQKKVPPFIIVFIDPKERMKEYWANDQFADFMARELVPFVDSHFRTVADRNQRALLGASLGGVISVWTALRHPDVFARVGGQSSAFQIDEERVVAALGKLDEESRRKFPLRFYFDVGRMESVLNVSRRVRVILAAKGYPVTYRESEAGHNYTTWRDQLAEALTALWSN